MPELPEETFVRELFFDSYGIELRKVPESPDAKIYDFDLIDAGVAAAALEIKRFERPPMTPENGWRDLGNGRLVREGEDKSAGRVGRAIYEKCKQLATCTLPKVLVFVNDDGMDALDFQEAFRATSFTAATTASGTRTRRHARSLRA
jgi:hypothetical protein